MPTESEVLQALEAGPLHSFCDCPNGSVPQVAAGVYTIWKGEELIYAGMSGRSLNAGQAPTRAAAAHPTLSRCPARRASAPAAPLSATSGHGPFSAIHVLLLEFMTVVTDVVPHDSSTTRGQLR
jgi:hypothetical protein